MEKKRQRKNKSPFSKLNYLKVESIYWVQGVWEVRSLFSWMVFLMKVEGCIPQLLSGVSSEGESLCFQWALRTRLHLVSAPDVDICSLILWACRNDLKNVALMENKATPVYAQAQRWSINRFCALQNPNLSLQWWIQRDRTTFQEW